MHRALRPCLASIGDITPDEPAPANLPPPPRAVYETRRDAGDDRGHSFVCVIPSPLAWVRHAGPSVLESAVVPFGLFYGFLAVFGLRGALIGALAWSHLCIARRLVRRQAVPGVLVLGSLVLTVRTIIGLLTGSAFLYFLQPAAATAAVGLAFLGSTLVGRPLVDRLARDFCPLDAELLGHPHVRRVFTQLSLLWAATMLVNAGLALWFLLTSSVQMFVVERTAATWLLTAVAIAASTLHFTRAMRRAGGVVRWGKAGLT